MLAERAPRVEQHPEQTDEEQPITRVSQGDSQRVGIDAQRRRAASLAIAGLIEAHSPIGEHMVHRHLPPHLLASIANGEA